MAFEVLQPHSPEPMIWNAFPCFDLINSRFREHTGKPLVFDRLAMPGWQSAFLRHWGWRAPVPAQPADLRRLVELRDRVRRFLKRAAAGRRPTPGDLRYFDELLAGAPFVYSVGTDGRLEVAPAREGWAWAVAGIVSSAVQVAGSGEVRRIKECANPNCSWLFYDETLNLSRRWCQLNYCGNLMKVREHRARRRSSAS
ncbi:MAG TPA: CGNR zinc finger domain-containing protein [Candidatus Dormibacteraeota bacterium]